MSEPAPFVAPDLEDLAPLFPGYSIDSLIACGGMGAVYHARQVALDREVAIKILPREFSTDEAFRDGFAAEAKAMARLNHPNLIGVYDFGEADGMLFIIMEFVSGESLYHAAYGKAIEPREAARLMSEICSGIAEAHRHGILHRDIKPANVLLDGHARPKIGDFGLARPIGSAAQEGEVIFGTPHYTAPEVVNHPSQVDARADVFSLGVVLHELLTGKLPALDTRPPSAISGCNPKFDAIVKRATQPLPALRYPDAATMASELAALAVVPAGPQIRGGAVRPPTVRRPTGQRTVVKSSGGFGFGWVVVLLLLGGGGYYYYTHHMKPAGAVPTLNPLPKEEPLPTTGTPLPPIQKTTDEAKTPPPLPGDAVQSGGSGTGIFDEPKSTAFGTTIPHVERSGPKPIFDVDGFLVRGRGIMKGKVTQVKASRDRALSANIDTLDREVSRKARGEGSAVVAATTEAFKAVRAAGNKIPSGFEIRGLAQSEYSDLLEAAEKKEEEIEDAYHTALRPHADSYMLGIDLQIKRLTNDPGAVEMLQDEIQMTKSDTAHFADVLEE